MDCPICGTDRVYEMTTFGDPRPVYLCFNSHRFVDVDERQAPSLGRMEGPSVPTPEEILKGAGLDGPVG